MGSAITATIHSTRGFRPSCCTSPACSSLSTSPPPWQLPPLLLLLSTWRQLSWQSSSSSKDTCLVTTWPMRTELATELLLKRTFLARSYYWRGPFLPLVSLPSLSQYNNVIHVS